MIIHCVKTNLVKIRCTGCIQGNRIALTVFDSRRHANMIFGLLHYRKCHPGPVGKRSSYTARASGSGASLILLSYPLTNALSLGADVLQEVSKPPKSICFPDVQKMGNKCS